TTDPPALGALEPAVRARLAHCLDYHDTGSPTEPDVLLLWRAYKAQAARLAVVEAERNDLRLVIEGTTYLTDALATVRTLTDNLAITEARLTTVQQERDAMVRGVRHRINSLLAWADPSSMPPSHANLRDVAEDLQAAIDGAAG